LSALSKRAISEAKTFKAQDVSNLMWGLATLSLEPSADLVCGLEARVIEVADSFITQHLANTMWSIAQMGIGKDVRKDLEPAHASAIDSVISTLSKQVLRRETRDLLPDQCAILGWSFVVLELQDGALLLHLLEGLVMHIKEMDESGLRQTHQLLLSISLDSNLKELAGEHIDALVASSGKECREAFERAHSHLVNSKIQSDVATHLKMLGLTFEEEAVDSSSGYTMDMFVENDLLPEAAQKYPKGCAVEVDGPFHFLEKSHRPLGHTLLKRRHMLQIGYLVVPVPYWEWDEFTCASSKNITDAQQKEAKQVYLRALLSQWVQVPENPAIKSEQPAIQSEVPASKTELTQPESKSELPAITSEETANKSEEPVADTEMPAQNGEE